MSSTSKKPQCLQCRHFRNSPEYLEATYKGLATLSSAYGSVRSEDGICVLNDLYLSANRYCDRFDPVRLSAPVVHTAGHIPAPQGERTF